MYPNGTKIFVPASPYPNNVKQVIDNIKIILEHNM